MAMSSTISQALEELAEVLPLLDDAYWACDGVEHKNLLHNLIWMLSTEMMELQKVSVQDGHFKYEPVTENLHRILPQLQMLREKLNIIILRTEAAATLGAKVENVISLLS
jgi:hypothetical protein